MKRIVYDYMDESSIDEDLKCSICREAFQDPVQTPCDHTFCEICIQQWINEDNNSCPTCRRSLSTNHLIPTTRIVLNLLDRLKVQCKLCGQKSIQRSMFIDHINKICPKVIISCNASDILCKWKGTRDLFSKHSDQCPHEQIRPVLKDLIQTNYDLNEKMNLYRNQIQEFKSKIKILEENQEDFQDEIEQLIENILEKDKQILKLELNQQISKEENQLLIQQLKETNLIVQSINKIITFDNLDNLNKSTCDEIPLNYFGYKWINGWYITKSHALLNHPNQIWLTPFNHRHNHTAVAFNKDGKSFLLEKCQYGNQFSIYSFEVISIDYLTLELFIIARRSKQQIYSTTIQLSKLVPYIVDLNWINIDQLEIKPHGITPIPKYKHTLPHFALISLQLTDN